MAHYLIGAFSQKTGLSIDTLRYYEKEHLLHPCRDANNRRFYTETDITWLQFIIRLKQTGMSIKNMQTYATLRYNGDDTIPQRLQLLFDQQAELLSKQAEINEHLTFLAQKINIYQGKLLNQIP